MGNFTLHIEGPRDRARQSNRVHIEQARQDGVVVPGHSDCAAPRTPRSAVGPLPQAPANGFDVVLCHNSRDKPEVMEIALSLRDRGISPWLDEWELRPGLSWQPILEAVIREVKAAVVFIGDSGIGPWQTSEQQAFLQAFKECDAPIIPVILPSCRCEPNIPIFLNLRTRIDFRRETSDPMELLVWGITGAKGGVGPLRSPGDTHAPEVPPVRGRDCSG